MNINTNLTINSNPKTTSSIEFSDAAFLESAFNKYYEQSRELFVDGPTIDIELGSVESGLRIESISTTYSFAPGISISPEVANYKNSNDLSNLYNSSDSTSNQSSVSSDSVRDGLLLTITPDGTVTKKPLPSTTQSESSQNSIDLTPSKVNYKGIPGDVFDTTKAKPSKNEVLKMIDEIAPKYGMEPSLIKAIVQAESTFNNQCISYAGAVGLIQLMPDTAREMGLTINDKIDERWDPKKNLEAGIKYIAKYHKIISERLGKEDWNLTIAGYNAGPNRVIRDGGIPNISQTQRYVKKVNEYWKNYK